MLVYVWAIENGRFDYLRSQSIVSLIVLEDCIFNSDTQDNLEYRYIRIWVFSPQMLYMYQ